MKVAHSLAEKLTRLCTEANVNVVVEQRGGELEERERDPRRHSEGRRVAEPKDVRFDLEREMREGSEGLKWHLDASV